MKKNKKTDPIISNKAIQRRETQCQNTGNRDLENRNTAFRETGNRNKTSKRHKRSPILNRQSVFAGGFCVVAAAAIAVGIFFSEKTKTPYEKQVITLYAQEDESQAKQETNSEVGTDNGVSGGLKQVRDYGVELPETFQNPPIFESTFTYTGDAVLDTANRYAAMYDYDTAIETIQAVNGYEKNEEYTKALEEYNLDKSQLFLWNDNYTITHIFFHTLIVDPAKTFDVSLSSEKQVIAYNEAMTTINEFVKIIQKLYDDGYVLVGLHDVAEMVTQPDGTQVMQMKPIYLPAGKTPFVLSQDDVCYYEYMTGQGFADRFVIDEDGKITNEYTLDDGTVIRGSFDVLTILEDFIEAHPDFSYHGARGTLAVTGYNGVFGYRTSDYWYNWNCDYFDQENADERQRMYFNNENIEADKVSATEVANAIKDLGWTIASHSWGHIYIGSRDYEHVCWDTDMWEREVAPIVGNTDIIIFAFGEDLDSWQGYAADNEKFLYLKQKGFNYYCNVDASSEHWIQIGANKDYFRQARRNLDGTRMWEAVMSYTDSSYKNRLSDLFDARDIFDSARPTPVE